MRFVWPALALPAVCLAQLGSPTCNITAVPAQVRAEGVAERLGDIILNCSGTPGREITGNLSVGMNTTFTNRLVSGTSVNVSLTVNNGSGEVPANVPATLAATNQITFSGLRFSIGPSGAVDLRISNLRGDASFGGSGGLMGTPVIAQLAFSGGLLNFTNTNFHIGVPERGLYSTSQTTVVPNQLGSPVPETIGFVELIRERTLFASTRVTEGFASAFEPRQAQTDHGTRVMLRFSGYPSDARLFVPAAIAGSNAEEPTRAGDFGGRPSGGRYQLNSRTLLLAHVNNAGADGSGGVASAPAGDGETFNEMREVRLTNGSGVAVFEVMDSDPQRTESAQIPVFIGLPRAGSQRNVTLGLKVSFAPLSATAGTSSTAPIPRFADVTAPNDCDLFRDCNLYVPKLEAPPVNTTFTLVRGVGVEQRLIPLGNSGGGLMPWTANVEYKNGTGWVLFDPTAGLEPLLIRMIVTARTEMPVGLYEATLIIDAGAAGVARYPISLRVVEPPVVKPKPAVSSVVHGATFQAGPIARGSFITLRGTNLDGTGLSVTIDGKAAKVVYASSQQLNIQVPADVMSNSAPLVVTVDGVASDPLTVSVAAVNPGIFNPGILNQDGSINSANNPANTGSYIQIFATGLLPPDGQGIVEATFHDQTLTNLPYAGNAPGIPGLQQVNLQVPIGMVTMMTEIRLCTTAGGSRMCSAPAQVHVRQVQ